MRDKQIMHPEKWLKENCSKEQFDSLKNSKKDYGYLLSFMVDYALYVMDFGVKEND
jgi:hypothetical protein